MEPSQSRTSPLFHVSLIFSDIHILLVKFHVQDNSPTFSLIRLINYKSIERLEMEVRELEVQAHPSTYIKRRCLNAKHGKTRLRNYTYLDSAELG